MSDVSEMLPHCLENCPLNTSVLTRETGMTKDEITHGFSWIRWGFVVVSSIVLTASVGALLFAISARTTIGAVNTEVQSHDKVAVVHRQHIEDKLTIMMESQREWREESREDMRELTKKVDNLRP